MCGFRTAEKHPLKFSVFLVFLFLFLLLPWYHCLIHKIQFEIWDFHKTGTLCKIRKSNTYMNNFWQAFRFNISSGVDQQIGDLSDQICGSIKPKITNVFLSLVPYPQINLKTLISKIFWIYVGTSINSGRSLNGQIVANLESKNKSVRPETEGVLLTLLP